MATVTVGQRFGEWEVLEGGDYLTTQRIKCRCSCGTLRTVLFSTLKYGSSTRCAKCNDTSRVHQRNLRGCLVTSPGYKDFPVEYRTWVGIHSRCRPPGRYFSRGITVDPKWGCFWTFLRDMGCRPEGMSIDRINNDGPYSAENCRWATAEQQARNKSNTWWVDTENGPAPAAELAAKTGLTYQQSLKSFRETRYKRDSCTLDAVVSVSFHELEDYVALFRSLPKDIVEAACLAVAKAPESLLAAEKYQQMHLLYGVTEGLTSTVTDHAYLADTEMPRRKRVSYTMKSSTVKSLKEAEWSKATGIFQWFGEHSKPGIILRLVLLNTLICLGRFDPESYSNKVALWDETANTIWRQLSLGQRYPVRASA